MHTPKIRTERSKIFAANFFSGIFKYQTEKPEQDLLLPHLDSACAMDSILNTQMVLPLLQSNEGKLTKYVKHKIGVYLM